MAPAPLSSDDERERKIVGINADTVTNVTSTDFPGHYPGEDHSWSVDKFARNLRIKLHHQERNEASFSLIGIDASIANAFRRILIAEVPTLAIEYVFVESNDSVISDEVFAARLGQIPLSGPPRFLKWLKYTPRPPQGMLGEDTGKIPDDREATDQDTVVLNLNIKCEWKEGMKGKDGTPEELYEHSSIYASDLVFNPEGRQALDFKDELEAHGGIKPVHPRILIAKVRPGDEVNMVAHAVKGIGGDHAKFSPVATASYRLLPTIDIVKPIIGTDARKFARCFPRGVIGLDTVTKEESEAEGSGFEGEEGKEKAVVRDTMRDTVSRECLRHPEFQGKVKLGRVQDHFIFSVESSGQFPSDELFIDSVKLLRGKCKNLKGSLANIMR